MSAEEAAAVSSVLEGNRKMMETEDLATRLQRRGENGGRAMSSANLHRRNPQARINA